VGGERRSYALLRPIENAVSQDRLRDVMLAAFAQHEGEIKAAGD